jgi:P-type Cu2+ transporter
MGDASSERCAHCGLGLGDRPVAGTDGLRFCCVGCAGVWSALHEAGLDSFYTWRDVPIQSACAVPNRDEPIEPAAIDGWARHAHDVPGGRALELILDGLHCAGCVWLIERLPHHIDGIAQARLDLGRGRLKLVWAGDEATLERAVGWLRKFGYGVSLPGASAEQGSPDRALLRRMGVGWALTGNIMLLSAAHYAGLTPAGEPMMALAARWISLVLASISLLYGGDLFLRRAWVSIRAQLTRGVERPPLSIDVPLALGILVGWLASARAVWRGEGEVWFDSIVMLTTVLLTARLVQARATRMARQAAERLVALLPLMARRLDASGAATMVEVQSLAAGERIEVRAGERFPADGLVEHGATTVHRAVLTGESMPEPVEVGGRVEAGTTNMSGPVVVRVEAVGEATRVGKLLSWVESQSARRAPTLQLVDRLGGWFVAVVLTMAALAGWWSWGLGSEAALARVVAVLVVSCPCALGMATPMALAVFVGRAARAGIFIKHDDVLDHMAGLTHVIFDKTGTLTQGRMVVERVVGDGRCLALASALEVGSNHPIARAIAREAGRTHAALEASEIEEIAGAGMRGLVAGRRVAVGKPAWFGLGGQDAGVRELVGSGLTPVAVMEDGQLLGLIGLGDPVRADAAALIAAMRARGITPMLLSGDHPETVARVGAQVGLAPHECIGGETPEGKVAQIMRLKGAFGATVAMVGDGVNDAAAMQAADVGVAVHGCAEVSLVAADLFLGPAGPGALPELVDGARRVSAVVRRNLVGSGLYNVFGITLAFMGYVTPLFGAILMPLSSLSVVLSSLQGARMGAASERAPGIATPVNP